MKKVDGVKQLLELNEMGNLLQKSLVQEVLILLHETGINYQTNILRILNLNSWYSLNNIIYRLRKCGFIKIINEPNKNVRTKILLEMQQENSLSRTIRLERLNRIIFFDLTDDARKFIQSNKDYFTRRANFMVMKNIQYYVKSFSNKLRKLTKLEKVKKQIEEEDNQFLTKADIQFFQKLKKDFKTEGNEGTPFDKLFDNELLAIGQYKYYCKLLYNKITIEEYKNKVKKYLEMKT